MKKNKRFFFIFFIFFFVVACQQDTEKPTKDNKEVTKKQSAKAILNEEKLIRFSSITIKQLKKIAKSSEKESLMYFGDKFLVTGVYERSKVCLDEAIKRNLLLGEQNHVKAQLKKCEGFLNKNIKVKKRIAVPTVEWWNSLPIEWKELLNETAVSLNPIQADMDKLFYKVDYLNFKNTAISSLEPIAPLVNLTSINADNSILVSLYGAAKLEKMQSIRAMRTKIVSLNGVENLKHLRELRCAYNNISSLKPLENLPALTHLDIRGTKVTSLAPISHLSSLEQLLISNLNITVLGDIKSLTGLETIFCDQTRIDTLGELSRMKNLKTLNITKTNIRSLAPLDELKKLEKLYCMTTPLSKKEINRFKKLHPKCQVYSNFDKPKQK